MVHVASSLILHCVDGEFEAGQVVFVAVGRDEGLIDSFSFGIRGVLNLLGRLGVLLEVLN